MLFLFILGPEYGNIAFNTVTIFNRTLWPSALCHHDNCNGTSISRDSKCQQTFPGQHWVHCKAALWSL
jgi:hypothetical protein